MTVPIFFEDEILGFSCFLRKMKNK